MNLNVEKIDNISQIDSDTYHFNYHNRHTIKIKRVAVGWSVSLNVTVDGVMFQYNKPATIQDKTLFEAVKEAYWLDSDSDSKRKLNRTKTAASLKELGVIK